MKLQNLRTKSIKLLITMLVIGQVFASKKSLAQTVTQSWGTVQMGTDWVKIAIDGTGNAYIVTSSNHRINKIASTGGAAGFGSLGNDIYPCDIAIDASNNAYTANGQGSVSKIVTSGSITQPWATLPNGDTSLAIAIDALGNIYTANRGSNGNQISKITPTGVVTTFATIPLANSVSDGMVIDALGNIFVSNYLKNSPNTIISKITSAGIVTATWATLTSYHVSRSLTIDAIGNLYSVNGNTIIDTVLVSNGDSVVRIASDRISKITPTGVVTESWLPFSDNLRPSSVAIDATGNVYVASWRTSPTTISIVSQITSGGTITSTWATLAPTARPASIALDGTGNIYTANQGNNTVSKITVTPLPLSLTSFSANLNYEDILLNWQTTNEVNASHFIIQHSTDGGNFTSIAKVVAKGGGVYSYTDNQLPTATTIYYRLQMVHKDGSYTYSKVVAVTLNVKSKTLNIFPNPVKETLFVQLSASKAETVTLQITDMQGKVLQQQVQLLAIGSNNCSINTNNLAKGSYVLIVKGQTVQQKQFVKE